jgi:hypothetical protein
VVGASRLVLVALFVLCASGCSNEKAEGVGVSVQATYDFGAALRAPLRDGDIVFSGETATVRLADEKTVEAIATKEQMRESFWGKKKGTLEQQAEGKWTITKLE